MWRGGGRVHSISGRAHVVRGKQGVENTGKSKCGGGNLSVENTGKRT